MSFTDNLTDEINDFIENFEEHICTGDFDVKKISGENGDFGDLIGVQFDSDDCGGYIYFWSNGFIGFQLFDYLSDEEIIEDTLLERDDQPINVILEDLMSALTNKAV